MIVPTLRLGLGLRFPGPGPSFASTAVAVVLTGPAFQADFTGISSLPSWLSFSRATTGTYFDASGVLQTAAIGAPRFDHAWNGSAWVANGLLIEEQRTNLCTKATDVSTWPDVNSATLASGVADLSGGTTGTTITANAGSTTHAVGNTLSANLTSGSTYTLIFYLKQGTAPYTVFGEVNGSNWLWGSIKWSDLSLATSGTDSATITKRDMGNGVYAVSLTWVRDANGNAVVRVGPHISSAATIGNNNFTYTAVGTETAIVLACQLEAGAPATSLIPTTTAAVTRSAEVVQLTGTALTALQGVAGTLLIETGDSQTDAFGGLVTLNTEAAYLLYYPLGSPLKTYNGTDILATTDTPNFLNPVRAGVAWDGSGRSLVDNGLTVATDAHSTPTIVNVRIGSSSNPFRAEMHVRSLAIYNTRLSDIDLQAKSVVGATF